MFLEARNCQTKKQNNNSRQLEPQCPLRLSGPSQPASQPPSQPAKRMTDLFYPRSASLGLSTYIHPYRGLSGPIWASLGRSVRLCACLSEALWASLGLCGPLWASLGLSTKNKTITQSWSPWATQSSVVRAPPVATLVSSFLCAPPVATQFSVVRAPPVATIVISFHRIISLGTACGDSVFCSVTDFCPSSGTASGDPFVPFDFIASFLWALPVATQFSVTPYVEQL